MLRLLFEKIQFIHFYPLEEALGRSLGYFWGKIIRWNFLSVLKEDIWQKKIQKSMQG